MFTAKQADDQYRESICVELEFVAFIVVDCILSSETRIGAMSVSTSMVNAVGEETSLDGGQFLKGSADNNDK